MIDAPAVTLALAIELLSGSATSAGAASVAPVAATSPPPTNVRIAVELTDRLTSLTAHVGDTFAFKTARDVRLGDLAIPAGSAGHGRIAVVTPAHDRVNGTMALQADSIDLPGGTTVWVNVDPANAIRGHYSDRHTRIAIVPLLVGIVPTARTRVDGNLILEPGTPFTVVTIAPRSSPAPLVTATPEPKRG